MESVDVEIVTSATKAFMLAIAEASALVADGITGPELNELIAHAGELLDIIGLEMRKMMRIVSCIDELRA